MQRSRQRVVLPIDRNLHVWCGVSSVGVMSVGAGSVVALISCFPWRGYSWVGLFLHVIAARRSRWFHLSICTRFRRGWRAGSRSLPRWLAGHGRGRCRLSAVAGVEDRDARGSSRPHDRDLLRRARSGRRRRRWQRRFAVVDSEPAGPALPVSLADGWRVVARPAQTGRAVHGLGAAVGALRLGRAGRAIHRWPTLRSAARTPRPCGG